MDKKLNEAIEVLAKKAKDVQPHEALHYTQAVLNLAHARHVLAQLKSPAR